MPIYTYKALDKTGREIKANLNAESLVQAKQKIKTLGVMPISINEVKSKKKSSSGITFGSKVSIEDLGLMTRQLSTLIKARIQIVEALTALIDQVDNDVLRIVLSEVKQKVNEGASLAKALSDHPKIFNNVFVNMVEAGETSGTLDIVLLRLADFTESQMKLKNKIKGAMIYPVIMACFGFIMMNVIFIFVIPKIAKIFESRKMELPWMTEFSIQLSHFLTDYWYLVIIFIVGSIYLFRSFISKGSGMNWWHSFVLKVPVAGEIIRMINVSRFCSTLATLLNSGVPMLVSMRIVKNLIPNVHLKGAIEVARQAVSEGKSMTGPLIQSGLWPSMVTHMIKLGENSGELEPMLQIVAENYEVQVDTKLNGLTSILEPIMMVLLGGAVGFIVFSVVVPMMEMNKI